MTFFSVFKNLKQILEVSDDIWQKACEHLRIFVMIEGENEGVFIDTQKKLISFPVSVREHPASATFIFTAQGFEMAFEGVMFSSLYEKDFLLCHGEAKQIFMSSVFLDYLLRTVYDEERGGVLEGQSEHLH